MHDRSWTLSMCFLYLEVFLGVLDQLEFFFEWLSNLACSLVPIWVVQTYDTQRVSHFWIRYEARSTRDGNWLTNWIHLFWALLHCLKSLPTGLADSKWQLRLIVLHLWPTAAFHESNILSPNTIPLTAFPATFIANCWGSFCTLVTACGLPLNLLGLGVKVVHDVELIRFLPQIDTRLYAHLLGCEGSRICDLSVDNHVDNGRWCAF